MDISIHLLTTEEKKYAYYYSQQIAGQTGLIGRLRSRFDPDGESLNSTWEEYYTSLATPGFKATATQVFNTLRYGPVYIDKHDCIILDGDKLRFDDGSVETIHTLETNVKGYCITNPDFLKHHPDAELKYTPLIANECTPELRKVRDVEIVGLKDQSSRHNDAFCGAILSSFSAFCAYCGFINDKGCGLRIDAGEYVFLLRLNPVMGQTNVDCIVFERYTEALVSDDFAEIAQVFGERIASAAEEIIKETEKVNEQVGANAELTASDCTPVTWEDSIENKVIAIKGNTLRPEFRHASHQLMLCTGGFGSQANARGRTCHCVSLFDQKAQNFARSDILGTLEPDNLPEWAKEGLEKALKGECDDT